MRKTLTAASLLVLAACSAPLPELRPVLMHDDQSALDMEGDAYSAGKRHLAAGQLGLAVERFRTVIARDRDNLAALNALAACYDRLGRFDLADRYYDRALALAPADAQTLNNMGISNLMRGRPERAQDFLARAQKAAPEDASVAANLGRATKARELELAAAASAEEEEPRPNRLERVGPNAWSLNTRAAFVPALWLSPKALPSGEEPPLPVAAPRLEVTRVELDAPAAAAPARAKPVPALGRVSAHVLNGVGRRGMAARMRAFLMGQGLADASIGDAPTFDVVKTVLTHHPSRRAEAEAMARLLPVDITLRPDPTQRRDLVLVLGQDLASFNPTDRR